ncbi:multidrug efflux system membrane fusion protein [Variovorax boronicumulans]|uniref:Multidrug efflux system membrane fusion protein n=1 Tax=Variovorax boronicumulans TaxID=436515 RepID=A0AAW8E0Y0_9BURK|nr:efflux RND transporter periplasmic adaptor subunit [Variovorax boronicumulans]MDP9880097.1 multidrug efflux system membrane fusion protein [Variovorax boronicumulans]MDP9925179.1 multidrug efflux system membrane fusion protein [Variovorax boronicumulans]
MNKQSRTWLGAGLTVAVLGAAGYGLVAKFQPAHAQGGAMPPAKVAVAPARQTEMARFLGGIGTLEANRQVEVPAEVEGRVAKILFTPGAQVRAGQLLVQLNDAPEQGDLERLRAQQANAKALLERTRRLLPQQAATQEQMEQAQAAFDQASGELRRVQALIEQKHIRAPFDGVLGIRKVNLGQFVRAGDALVSLTDARTLFANLTLPENALPALRRNQAVALAVDAYPGRVFPAKLSAIEPMIGSDTRTVRLQATVDNADGALTPGMYVNAKVALPARADAIAVPETAITYSTHGDSVFVVRAGEKGDGFSVQQVFVKTGERQDGLVVVEQGLKAGEQVVTSGQLRLYNGAAVAPAAKDTLALQDAKS